MNSPASPATVLAVIKRHPVAAFVVIAIAMSWTVQVLSLLLLGNILPGILAELLILLGTAVLVTAAADGRPAVRELFRRAFRWNVGAGWYVAALLALPALTALIAVATGTFHPPTDGWLPLAGNYLLNTVIIGALLGNIWEELAWTGVVQHRLIDRHGPVVAALLTAIPFALTICRSPSPSGASPALHGPTSRSLGQSCSLLPRSFAYSWGGPTWERATACS